MKRLQLKEMIQESIIEMLPEIIEIIQENLNEVEQPKQNRLIQTPDLTLIRKHAMEARGSGGYDDFPSDNVFVESSPALKNIPPAANPKAIIGGEVFASGKGIMEWFAKGNGKLLPKSELSVQSKDMDEFMRKRFGVK